MNILGQEVAKVRKLKGITQEQLGKKVGLPKSSISKIENGHTRLTWEDASILFEAMGETLSVPVTYLEDSEEKIVQKSQLITSCIQWFALAKNIMLSEAYRYLLIYKGIDFLSNNFLYEQTLPKETILNDLSKVCSFNGGKL